MQYQLPLTENEMTGLLALAQLGLRQCSGQEFDNNAAFYLTIKQRMAEAMKVPKPDNVVPMKAAE